MRIALSALALLLVSLGLGLAVSIRAASAREGSPASPEVLRRGHQVYEINCVMCHGINGDGQGMAAHMFRVPPRDFRQGFFKFRSTSSGSMPTDNDLLQTVTQGIRWTGMVGRPDLSEADRRAVVQYLKTFSPRFAAEPPAGADCRAESSTAEPGPAGAGAPSVPRGWVCPMPWGPGPRGRALSHGIAG